MSHRSFEGAGEGAAGSRTHRRSRPCQAGKRLWSAGLTGSDVTCVQGTTNSQGLL